MATLRELIYMVNDTLKMVSDDSFYTEEHIKFLIDKFRIFVIKKEYDSKNESLPDSYYQTLCLSLEEVPAISGVPCEGGSYLKSVEKIPEISELSITQVYQDNYFNGSIAFVSPERFKFVGHNRWLQNIIYASVGPDNYLYLKSSNPQYIYLESVVLRAILENPEEAASLTCEGSEDTSCDPYDIQYPIEAHLIPSLIELVVKSLSGAVYRPMDVTNNDSDDLSDIMAFIRRNMKNNFQKQMEDD